MQGRHTRRAILRGSMGLGALGALGVAGTARAQDDYPSRPIRIVVPAGPGFGTDFLARMVGEHLRAKWNQPVTIDNRAGAGGNLGAELAARAAPDGYTLMITAPAPLTINKVLYGKLNYEPADFVPISTIASIPNVLVVRPELPVKTLGELIAYAKANPGKLNYATGGAGTTPHLAAEMLKSITRTHIVHIPYRASAASTVGVLQGQADMLIAELSSTLPHIQSGKLRALAVGSDKRAAALPDVPTFAETLPGFQTIVWYGVVAPPKTPSAIADKLSAAVIEQLRQPDVVARLRGMQIDPMGGTPAEMAKLVQQETQRWGKVIRDAKIAVG